MAKRGENIRKRKDGRWEGRYILSYSDTGKAVYHSIYGKTYAEVKEKLKQHKVCHDKKICTQMTMQELFVEWLNMKQGSVKESTYVKYYGVIYRHFIPYFRGLKAFCLSNENIQGFILQKSSLSEKTVHDMVSVLFQIVRYGQSKKYIDYFDCQCVIFPKVPCTELKVLKKSEIAKLVNYIKSTFEIRKIGILLSLFMGIRIGEICALQWNDVNFSDEVIHIEKTMQRLKSFDTKTGVKTRIVIDTPKSQKSIRDIPIPSFLLELMKKYKSESNTFLLTGTASYIEPTVYERFFSHCLKEAEIETTNFHTLRHTFATQAVEQGFDIKSLSELLGHSSVKFTMERYVHPSDTHKKMNMEKMKIFY